MARKLGWVINPMYIIICVTSFLLLVLAFLFYHSVFISPQLKLQRMSEDPNVPNPTIGHASETALGCYLVPSSSGGNKFKVLIGILTMASKTERRNILRLAYGVQSSEDADVTVRFVLGALKDVKERTLVGMENATYGDIIVLGCEENLNNGKTFTYFSSLPARGLKYDYVMKTDDDSYVRIQNLGRHLRPLPRLDLYYGYVLPCESQNAYAWYMSGMGYLISWDIVEWIAESPIPRNQSIGTEDKLVGDWLNEGGKAKNRVNDKPLFYDHPEFGGNCAHEFFPETILIHKVKTTERWIQVLSFFETSRIDEALTGPLSLLSSS